MKKLLLVTYLFVFSVSMQAQEWQPLTNNANALGVGGGFPLASDASGNIYTIGEGQASAGSYSFVAKWNGTVWSEVAGSSVGDSFHLYMGGINAIVTDKQGNVYVAGSFQNSNGYFYVAKWDGTTWKELAGTSIADSAGDSLKANSNIFALAVDIHGNVYAGGEFYSVSPDSTYGNYYVAKWNGSQWIPLSTTTYQDNSNINGLCNNIYITAITTDNKGNLYAAFNTASVAQWNGTDSIWNVLGGDSLYPSSLYNDGEQINTIAVDSSGNVYAGGCFTIDASLEYSPVIKWDGTKWSILKATGADSIGYGAGAINDIIVDKSGNLYAVGAFNISEPVEYSYVAMWNGAEWSALAAAPTGDTLNIVSIVKSIVMDNSGNLYISSDNDFNNPDGYYIAEWTTNGATAVTNAATSSPALINVFPNPTNGSSFTINAPEAGVVTVYSIVGEVVTTQNVPAGNSQINLGNGTGTGIYTVILTGSNSTYTPVKVVKN